MVQVAAIFSKKRFAPAEKLVEELAGSVLMPKKWIGKDVDQIIDEARNEYFQNKYPFKAKII